MDFEDLSPTPLASIDLLVRVHFTKRGFNGSYPGTTQNELKKWKVKRFQLPLDFGRNVSLRTTLSLSAGIK